MYESSRLELKHCALGAELGHAVLVELWRALLPVRVVDASFESM